MRKTFLTFCILLAWRLGAAPMMTSFGSLGEKELGGYGLMVKKFSFDHALESAEALRVCEALDGSNCVIISDMVAPLNFMFQEATVCDAMTRLLERGGMVFISIPSWTWMGSRPQKMFAYFKSIDAPLPEKYSAFPSQSKNENCEITKEFAGKWPSTPESAFPIIAGGHAGKGYDRRWKSVWVS